MKKITGQICIILLLLFIASCGEGKKKNNTDTANENDKNKPVKISTELDEAARFLAGKPLADNSTIKKMTKKSFYTSYINGIKRGWDRFQKPNLKKMKEWWQDHKPENYNKNILYPFSGPDIMNALTLFPDGDIYIMFGLENPGAIPAPHKMDERQIRAGLRGIKSSLTTIFRYNFFRTKGMAKKLGSKSFNGITGLIMFFLSLNDYSIVDVKKIVINKDSKISPWRPSDNKTRWQHPPASRRIPGVQIRFRKGEGKVQTIRYYNLNVIDRALTKYSPNFIPYLKSEGRFTTVIKSASYLMHNDRIKFTKIRKAILDSTDYIIEDDSGIPLRYLPSSEWNVKVHGFYDRPIPLFANRYQKDLWKKMKKESTGRLPFSYGYDYKMGYSNLITAERKKSKKP